MWIRERDKYRECYIAVQEARAGDGGTRMGRLRSPRFPLASGTQYPDDTQIRWPAVTIRISVIMRRGSDSHTNTEEAPSRVFRKRSKT